MKKILYIVSTLRKTGPTNQLYEMVKYLPKTEYIVRILTLSPEVPGNSRKSDFESLEVEVQSLHLGRIQGLLLAKRKIARVISELAPDIIHCCGIRADVLLNEFRGRVVCCSTIRNFCEEDYVPRYGHLIGGICTRIHLNVIRQMTYPICCSNSLQRKYEQKLNRKMNVIQNGVDINRFLFDDKRRIYLRKKFGIPENTFIFVSSGSLNNRKDPMTIIHAFQQLADKDTKLYILGDGPMKEACEVYRSNSILLEGNVDCVEDYLLFADAFVSASLSEGLPNSVLEAGAAGLPMILSDIPQHREIWCDEMEYVHFFHTGDVEMLEKKLKKIKSTGNNEEMRKAISESIVSRFSSEKMSQNYQCFYRFMLKKSE